MKFCPECGASVARRVQKKKVPGSSGWLWWILIGAGLFVVIVMLGNVANNRFGSGVTSPTSGRFRVTGATACASTLDQAGPLAQAYLNKDSQAVLGLIVRHQAIPLEAGVNVSVLVADTPFRGMHTLYVESGFYAGERCYGLASFLSR